MMSPPLATASGATVSLPLKALGESYASLLVVRPQGDGTLEASLRRMGQLSPVVVGLSREGMPAGEGARPPYELLDGFQRMRCLKKLGQAMLWARVVAVRKPSVHKAILFCLHAHAHGLSLLEEALIVRSLYREERMTQVEIGVLLSRHKSWVSRRIALVEGLTEEVVAHPVLQLIPLSVARMLGVLPRGNQERVLSAIVKHRLTVRECAAFLRRFTAAPSWEQAALLRAPYALETEGTMPRADTSLRAALMRLSRMALGLIPQVALWAQVPDEDEKALNQCVHALERCRLALLEVLARSARNEAVR